MDEKGTTHFLSSLVSSGAIEAAANAGPRPMFLIVVSGGPPGAMHKLNVEGTPLGRSQDNAVRFNDLSISRRHANFFTDSQGDVWVSDLGSTNGTRHNGVRLIGYVPQRIEDGDRLQFGSSIVVKYVRLDPCDEEFQRELFERTVRDPLTALYNRAYFLEQIGPLADLSAARDLGLAVLMVDIDHFKRINDTFGHSSGDSVLREAAVVLRESTRSEDLVARYGGEEFVVALPVAAPDQALERAERIREALASRRLNAPNSDRAIRVTASIGLSFAHPGRYRSASVMLAAADNCLYQAKDAGRNRVVVRVDPPPNSLNLVTPHSREC